MVVKISVLKTGLCVDEMRMRNCQIPTVPRHIFAYHFEEMTKALRYMNRDHLLLHVEPSGLGRDLFFRTFQFGIVSVYFLTLFDRVQSFAGPWAQFPCAHCSSVRAIPLFPCAHCPSVPLCLLF